MPRETARILPVGMNPLMPLLLLVAAVSFLLILAGCKKGPEIPTVFAYISLEEETGQRLLAAFEKETGIRVDFVRLSTGEASARIEAEKNNPQASIWLGGVGLVHAEAKEKGLTAPFDSPTTLRVPAKYRDPQGYWHGLYLGILAFAVNPEELKQQHLTAPQTWKDLTDPKWKDLIQLPNPGTSGTSYNLITTLIARSGEADTFEYLKALHKNVSQYTKSGAAPVKNVALGESVVGIGYSHDILRLIHGSKADLQIIYPKDGTGYEVASASLIKNGKHPELAQKLMDWLYGKTSSQIMANDYILPIMHDGIKLPPETTLPKDLKLIDSDTAWAGKNKQRLIELWNEKVNQ